MLSCMVLEIENSAFNSLKVEQTALVNEGVILIMQDDAVLLYRGA